MKALTAKSSSSNAPSCYLTPSATMVFDMTTISIPFFVYLLYLRIFFHLRRPVIRYLFPRLPHHVYFPSVHIIGRQCGAQ